MPESSTPAPPSRGFLRRIRVILQLSSSRPQKLIRLKYLAPLSRLTFDPGRWLWADGGSLYTYIAKKGQLLLNPYLQLSHPIAANRWGLVPAHFVFDWKAFGPDSAHARRQIFIKPIP
ncbi:hypothetical protein M758_UG068000 [Ceratodon purpureus]|nr:hypothetical protein M758_UG068000 [Ceratodon purpureus]